MNLFFLKWTKFSSASVKFSFTNIAYLGIDYEYVITFDISMEWNLTLYL